MNVETDYYAILGVVPSSPKEVIAAVYRALAKKYHPDLFSGGNEEAQRRMTALNEAYEVLSNDDKRRAYDGFRRSKFGDSGNYTDYENPDLTGDTELSEEWKIVAEFRPGCERARLDLFQISPALSITFQKTLLEKKEFDRVDLLKETLMEEYLVRYFGANKEIRSFAEILLRERKIAIARELNKVVKIISPGQRADDAALDIIQSLIKKYSLDKNRYRYWVTWNLDFEKDSTFEKNSDFKNSPQGDHNSSGVGMKLVIGGVIVAWAFAMFFANR